MSTKVIARETGEQTAVEKRADSEGIQPSVTARSPFTVEKSRWKGAQSQHTSAFNPELAARQRSYPLGI
jgi:hypothetical protein